MSRLRRWQRGDTIVEVLIAAAVVSSVLLGAFLVVQKSAHAVRAGQERSEMYQLLQGQVELVRGVALDQTDATSGVYDTTPAKYFCMDPATGARVSFANGWNLPAIDADDFAAYPPTACQNLQDRYNVAIAYNQTTDVFTFTGRWENLDGGRSQVSYTYRVHPK